MATRSRVEAALRGTRTSLEYREEARRLRLLSRSIWEESEELLRRARLLNERATRLEEDADQIEDEAEVSRLAGAPVRSTGHLP